MITYERQEWIIVNIDGRKVGKIKIIEKKWRDLFQYFPNGCKVGGVIFDTLDACKKSLEGI